MKVDRRQLLQHAVALTGGGLASSLMPAWAQSKTTLNRARHGRSMVSQARLSR